MPATNKKLTVFSIKKWKGGSIWVRAGAAWINKDGSMAIRLDVLPLDGALHVRETAENAAENAADSGTVPPPVATPAAPAVEANGHLRMAAGMEVQP